MANLALAALFGLLTVLAPAPAHAQGDLSNRASQNPAQQDMAGAISTMCAVLDTRVTAPGRTTGEDQLHIVCANLVFNDPETAPDADLDRDGTDDIVGANLSQQQLNAATQSLNGEELQAPQQQINQIRTTQVATISGRLAAIRAGLVGPGIDISGLNIDAAEHALAFQETDDDAGIDTSRWADGGILGRLGVFASGGVRFGDRDRTGEIEGFDFYTAGVTVGADYRLTDRFVLGGAVGYSHFDLDFDTSINSPSGQGLESDGVSLSLFGTYFPTDQLFVEGIASVGWNFYDATRRIVVPSGNPDFAPINARATGDFDAFFYGFAGNVGYDLPVRGFTVTPVVRLDYVRAEIDGYTEDTTAPVGLTYDDQTAESLTGSVGVEVSYPISTGFGVIMPAARAEYVHEFLDDPDGVRLQYANDPTGTSSFEVSPAGIDQDYGIVGASVTGTFANGWAAFVDYGTFVGLSDYTIHMVNVGFRKDF